MISENDLSKLARWIIPGWLGILSFYAFVITDILFTPATEERLFESVTLFFSEMTAVNAILVAFFIAASGVPLGFIIYQAYFYFRWNSPFSRDGLLPPLILGRMNDLEHLLRNISDEQLSGPALWRKNWVEHPFFARDHGFKWRYIELLFTEFVQKIDSTYEGLSLYDRHRYLHEIMHTLGASTGAVYLGFFSYFIVMYVKRDVSFSISLISVSVAVFILLLLLNRENKSKEDLINASRLDLPRDRDPIPTLDFSIGKSRFLICSPGSLYIFSLFLLHLFENPIINLTTRPDIWPKIILTAMMIFVWTMSKSGCSREFKYGDLLWLVISSFIAISLRFLPWNITGGIDWPFFTVIMAFLVANLILLQNRRNVNNDMLAMEYYTMQRFMSENRSPEKNTGEQG